MEATNLMKIIVISFGLIFLVWLTVKIYNISIHNRINKYTIKNIDNKNNSLQDITSKISNNIMNKIIKILSKSKIIKMLSLKYKKYLDNENDRIKFIFVKILVVIVLDTLYFMYAYWGYYDFHIIIFLMIGFLGYISPDYVTKRVHRQKTEELNNDFFNALVIMNNAFKANLTIVEAINIVVEELDGPIKKEFIKVRNNLNKGLELEVTLNKFYERVKLDEIKYLTMTLLLVHKTGGNIGDLFDEMINDFNNKRKLRNELRLLTSSSVGIYQMLLVLPQIILLGIYFTDSTYYDNVLSNYWGIIIAIIGVVLYLTYIFVIDQIVRGVFND